VIFYLEVFDISSGKDKRISMIKQRNSFFWNKDLIGLSRWSGHEFKRQTAERSTQDS
jgi:hypothetical protein